MNKRLVSSETRGSAKKKTKKQREGVSLITGITQFMLFWILAVDFIKEEPNIGF